MATGCSLEALQWLTFVDECDQRLTKSDGTRVRIEHKFFRGEVKFNEWEIDGYAEVDGQKLFYEFLGCYFHPGCPHCGNGADSDERFERKKSDLEKSGTVIIMRGCQWKIQAKKLSDRVTPAFPDVMNIFRNCSIFV